MKNGGFELGKAYWIDYWREYCLVVDLRHDENGAWYVTTKWSGNGRTTTHYTSLERRDREVPVEEFYAEFKR